MPWNETTRAQYIRVTERYASDLTDAEWELLVPLLPLPKRLGRPREVNMREVVNAILYLLWTGCAWRALPKDFPGVYDGSALFLRLVPFGRSGPDRHPPDRP